MMMATELRIKEAMIPKRSMQSDTVSVRPKSTIKNLQLYVLGSGGSLYGKYNAMEMWEQAYKDAEGVKEYAEIKTKYTGRAEPDRSRVYCGE